ncbi:hypothetical protein ABFO80_02770 [Acinetobacter towneri]|uniref:hypothetical protein n=1 Tax=Acinetobacter towneri TaxID=202956 RepID=UPI00321408C3
MILDKKQNFSLKPLSVACLLTMSISGCSSGSGSQSSTVQVTDVLGQKMSAKKINRLQMKALAAE